MIELVLDNYKVQKTGADGGHNYILTEIVQGRPLPTDLETNYICSGCTSPPAALDMWDIDK